MDITHKISLDLQKTGARQVMFAKQGDCLTRIARLLLYNGGTEFTVPSGTIMQIAYAKQDGKGGVYDTMPDGSAACTMSGNVVTAKLHPQMFSVAGIVACELRLLTGSGAQLSTFSWFITVQASAAEGIVSEDYFRFASLDGMRSDVGDLSNLSTSAKDNLVVAINEVAGKADNAATAAATARKTADQAATAAGNATTAAQNAQQTADQAATAAGNAATAAATAKQTADNAATAAGNAATAAATAQQTADQAATDAIKAAGAAAYAVKYRAQDLSDSQKKQARTNIGAPEMGVTDVTQEWLAWCDDKGIADADCTESDVFSFLKTLSSGIYCLTTGSFGQVWSLIYGAYSKHLVAFIEGRVYVEEATAIYDSGKIAYGGKKAKITDIADSVYEDVTSSYEATNTSGTLTPAGYVKSLAKDGKYRIRIGSIGDALFEKMTVDGSKWLFGRSTDGAIVSYTIERDGTTLLSMSTAGTAKIGDKTVLTDAVIAIPTSADAGKVLTVGARGNPEWTAVVNAEEVAV